MGAAAAIIIRKEREIVNTFRGAGATDPRAARDPGELGIDPGRTPFRLLVNHAVLRETDAGLFYLDEPSWEALGYMRQRMVLVIALITVVLLVAALVGGVGIAASR